MVKLGLGAMGLEKTVEDHIQELLQEIGYDFITPETNYWLAKRQLNNYINDELLLDCLKRINPEIKDITILADAIKELGRTKKVSLFERNKEIHDHLINGVTIERKELRSNPIIKFIDFENPLNNTFQFTRQFQCNEGLDTRIPDVVVFINGIPLVIMELKTFDEDSPKAQLEAAYNQIGRNSLADGYRKDIPTLFIYNAFIVLSDGANVKSGTLTSEIERYNEWKSIDGNERYDELSPYKLDYNIKGMFDKSRIIELIHNYIFFIEDKNALPIKIMAKYHQFFGVEKAFKSVLEHKKPEGDGKAGIISHTQGSGKSYSMLILAHKLIQEPSLNVPTIVMLTDRLDLDEQLTKTFSCAKDYLRAEPTVAKSRADLIDNKLSTIKQGGIIFTTIEKFDKNKVKPNDRTNIIVMTDEAHRSHYGLDGKVVFNKKDEELEAVMQYGLEKYVRDCLPNATYIGFTATPVETKDKQTTAIFGDIIDNYDMIQSVNDGSTVKLYHEGRLAKVWTDEKKLKEIDEYYNNIEARGLSTRDAIEKSKRDMSKLNIILEDPDFIELLASDIIDHYTKRKEILNGKAMIVCASRLMAYRLYNEIIKQAPGLKEETIAVVTESNKDTEEMRDCFGTRQTRKELADEFKKDTSKYKIAIVVDMWLTGFDVPDLDVMYFIKRLKTHNLMQAICRVNRVYPGKENGGLIVDYIGLRRNIDEALAQYTQRDKTENVQDIKSEIYNQLIEVLSVLDEWFYNIDKSNFTATDSSKRFATIQEGAQFIMQDSKREDEFIRDLSLRLKKSFVVASGALTDEQRNNALYYLSVRSFILRLKSGNVEVSQGDMNKVVSEILVEAIKGDEVKVLTKPTNAAEDAIELLSKENLQKLRETNPPNVFVQIVRSLLETAIKESRKNNYFKSQEYSERLKKILDKYNNRDDSFAAEMTILELVNFAGELVGDEENAKKLGITGREKAFYDALIRDKSAKELINDQTLQLIARELNQIVSDYSVADWETRKSTQAQMRIAIKKCLQKYNYPPEYREQAVQDVIKQAEYVAASK